MRMPVRLIVTFVARPGDGDDFLQAWRERLPEVLAEPGCEQYEFFRGVSNPDTLVLLERWSSADALAAHAKLGETRAPVGREFLAPDSRPVLERFEMPAT
jgi:quinol monooxygenase YgiN